MSVWYDLRSRLEIGGELLCKTGLRVGAGGESSVPTASDLPVLLTPDSRPYIPGSSLRGVLRAHIERLVRGIEGRVGPGRGACNPLAVEEWCLPSLDDLRREAAGKESDWLAKQVFNRSCRVCRVFGSPWLASRVKVADLPCVGHARVELRDGVSINREKETVENKYDFEAVPAGTRFSLRILAENLDESERGLLWLAMRELRQGHIQIGGFKGRGLGWVQVDSLSVRWADYSDRVALKQYLLDGQIQEVREQDADSWLDALWRSMEGEEECTQGS